MSDIINQYVTVRGYDKGIAFFVDGFERTWMDYSFWACPECLRSDDCECPDSNEEYFIFFEDGEWVESENMVKCHMVGDDATFYFDISDVTVIDGDDVCSCGQVGCWSPNWMSEG